MSGASLACEWHHYVKHVTDMHVGVIQPDPVLVIDDLVVEETGSVSAFIEKWIDIHVTSVNSYLPVGD